MNTIDYYSQKKYNICEFNMFKTQKLIFKRIKDLSLKAFTTSDFIDLGDYKTISKSLELLEDDGIIKRARRGVYYISRYNKLLKLESSVDLNDVANAIARQYNWRIVPSGIHALNIVGISTQVPNSIVFVSSGPYNQFLVGNNKIIFKHSTSKEVNDLSIRNLIAIQAIKELGNGNVTESDLKRISEFLNNKDKDEIKHKMKTTAWINDILRKLVCIKSQD